MSERQEKFIQQHKEAIGPVTDPDIQHALKKSERLTKEQMGRAIEEFETKVFTWKRPAGAPGSKGILLEASEFAAYRVVKSLIERLQQDERCKALTLVTDNVAGKEFFNEYQSLGLTQVRDATKPVMSNIEGPFDAALVLVEPLDSGDKLLLYSGRSVYGTDKTKLYCMLDGIAAGNAQATYGVQEAKRMDAIEKVFVANEFAKAMLTSIAPQLEDRIEIAGSLLLESLRANIESSKNIERQHAFRESLGIPEGAVVVFYSGFSGEFTALGGLDKERVARDGKTINERAYERTLGALKEAARMQPQKQYVLVVHTHPAAKGTRGGELSIPRELPPNVRVVRADGPELEYHTVANTSALIACPSTSSEVLLAPYRGSVPAVLDYEGEGMPQQVSKLILGPGLEVMKHSSDIFYVDSTSKLAEYLVRFQNRPAPRPIPSDPTPYILNAMLARHE